MEVVAAVFEGLRGGAVLSALGLGLRHGFDWDHIAAIADITGSQDDHHRSLVLATLYIAGHAVVVVILGTAAIALGSTIPAWLDSLMGRLVGATLLALGVAVLVSLVRHGRDARLRSRWMLALAGLRGGYRWIRARTAASGRPEPVVVEHDHEHPVSGHHRRAPAPAPAGGTGPSAGPDRAPAQVAAPPDTHRHRHAHVGSMPADPLERYGVATSLGVGAIHGVGAETPTQMVLFASAAGAATAWTGWVFLLAFVTGLVLANTAVALGSRLGILSASRNFAVFAAVSTIVALLSLSLGTVLVLGAGEGLPGILT